MSTQDHSPLSASSFASRDPGSGDCEERFRLFVEGVPDSAIFLLDPDGCVREWNAGAERFFGYAEAEIVGRSFARFFPPEVGDRAARELQTAASEGRASEEGWQMGKDGAPFWVSGVTTALRDASGALHGFAKVVRNLTERRVLEEELRNRSEALAEVDRRKEEFLALLAHELRNPLAPIVNILHVMRQEGTATREQQQACAMLDRHVRQLAHLVDDLLDVNRVTRGNIRLQTQRVRLGDIIAHAVQTAQPHLEARKHRFSLAHPPEPIWLDADPTRLAQVLANLLINAAKYTPPEGRIELAVERDGTQAVLQVTDNGVGLAPEMIPRIFDLFAQADRSLDRAQGGLGVGLTLARRLVELHGGKLDAFSAGSGRGSRFVVRLPRAADALAARTPVPANAPGARLRSLRVLVVDDNSDAAESLGLLLRMTGYEVQVAHDGPTALTMAVSSLPEVVVLDIGLPGLDGYQVAARLRQYDGTKHSVLIALTGYGQEGDKVRSKQAGFDYHLVKPAEPEQLQDLLTRVAMQHR